MSITLEEVGVKSLALVGVDDFGLLTLKVTLNDENELLVSCDGNSVTVGGDLSVYAPHDEWLLEHIEDMIMDLSETPEVLYEALIEAE